MASLAGRKILDTFKNLLQIDNSNQGIDSTLRSVSDGAGSETPLHLSLSKILIKPSVDNTAVYDVQDSSGTTLMSVDTTNSKINITTLEVSVTVNGIYISRGTTVQRPSLGSNDVCFYYDETIKTLIIWNGTAWT